MRAWFENVEIIKSPYTSPYRLRHQSFKLWISDLFSHLTLFFNSFANKALSKLTLESTDLQNSNIYFE